MSCRLDADGGDGGGEDDEKEYMWQQFDGELLRINQSGELLEHEKWWRGRGGSLEEQHKTEVNIHLLFHVNSREYDCKPTKHLGISEWSVFISMVAEFIA